MSCKLHGKGPIFYLNFIATRGWSGSLVEESTHRSSSALAGMTKATRLLCGMAIFAFSTFALVDPLVVEAYSTTFIWVRLTTVVFILLLLFCTRFVSTPANMQHLGGAVCVATGIAVVILTEMTGGAASAYWTMLMLTFFATALVLPMTPRWAAVYFGISAGFYTTWLLFLNATSDPASWASSNAGIWLALIVSVLGVAFIQRMRERDQDNRLELERLNSDLLTEIEHRREVNEKLLESQKLDAIGQLAAGVAHEMNNVLTAVSCTAENLKNSPSTNEQQAADIARILNAAERGEKLTSDLLGFARKTPQSTSVLSFAHLVSSVTDMVDRTHRGRVTVETEFADDIFGIRGDERILFQAVLNLCLNGVDAMSNGGHLRLETRMQAMVYEGVSQAGVELCVKDSGIGMSEDQLARAFEPFFTTKPVGKGTGLGLSMVYGAIDDHGGTVTLESAVGHGTTVRIWLPLADEPLPNSLKIPAHEKLSSIDGRVLVLDDDPLVREITCQILRQAGLEVFEANDGAEGLEKYRELNGEVELVVIDVIMPVLDGAEVFRRIREIEPEQPILLISGFAKKAVVGKLLAESQCRFLNKPFSAQGLLRMVDQLIHGSEETNTEPRPTTHILLVEDDDLLRSLTSSALQELGYKVTEAASGQLAKQYFEEGQYGAILLDLGLPDLPGITVAKHIRSHPRGGSVPILALSGKGTTEIRMECTEAGIHDFIAKPFNLNQLERRLNALPMRSIPKAMLESTPSAD